jgi:hypothetical protein
MKNHRELAELAQEIDACEPSAVHCESRWPLQSLAAG